MFTNTQRQFHELAEKLLASASDGTGREGQRLALAANDAAHLAQLAGSEGCPQEYLTAAFALLASHEYRPGWTEIHSASAYQSLIQQHIRAATFERAKQIVEEEEAPLHAPRWSLVRRVLGLRSPEPTGRSRS